MKNVFRHLLNKREHNPVALKLTQCGMAIVPIVLSNWLLKTVGLRPIIRSLTRKGKIIYYLGLEM
jgi:hypothetical protein